MHKNGFVINDISDDNFIYNEVKNRVYLIDMESVSLISNNLYKDIENVKFILRQPDNLSDICSEYYKMSLLFLYLIFGKLDEILTDEYFFEKRYKLVKKYLTTEQKNIADFALWLKEKSKNNKIINDEEILKIFNSRKKSEKIYKGYKKKTLVNLYDTLDEIKKAYLKKINVNSTLQYSSYVGNITRNSLVYGNLGTIVAFDKLNWLSKQQKANYINDVHRTVNKSLEKNQLNDGLFFGLAGVALFDFYMDIPFESNIYLYKLIRKLDNICDDSIANGISGIIYALEEMSSKKGYPNFDLQIEKLINKYKINLTEYEGLEYGDIGFAYVLVRYYKISKKQVLHTAKNILEYCIKPYEHDTKKTL